MKLEAYAIYDIKAKVYQPPRFALNEDTATRMFITMFNEQHTTYNMFPLDYQVFLIGIFDDETGNFNSLEKPTYKLTASDLIKKRSNDADQTMLFQQTNSQNPTQNGEKNAK